MGAEASVVSLDKVFITSLRSIHLVKSIYQSTAASTFLNIMILLVTSWPGLGCDNSIVIVLTLISITLDPFINAICLPCHQLLGIIFYTLNPHAIFSSLIQLLNIAFL